MVNIGANGNYSVEIRKNNKLPIDEVCENVSILIDGC